MDDLEFIWDSESEGAENNVMSSTQVGTKETKVEDIIDSDDDIMPKGKPAEVDNEDLESEDIIRNSLFATDEETAIVDVKEPKKKPSNKVTEDVEEDEQGSEEEDNSNNSSLGVNEDPRLSTLLALRERGIVELDDEDLQLEDGEELDDDAIEELINEGIEKKIDSKISSMMGELPDHKKQAVKFLLEGGDVAELANMYSAEVSGVTRDMDLDDENNQVQVVRAMLIEKGEDPEDAESYIEHLKDTNKLSSTANKYFTKWLAEDDKRIQVETEAKKKQKAEAIKEAAKYKKTINDIVSNKKEIKSYTIPRSVVKDLPSYLGDATVTGANGRSITGFQKDFMEAMKDPEKQVLIAALLKTDFDFTPIAKKAASKTTTNIKNEINRQSSSNRIKSTGGSQPKRLTDLI